MGCRELRSASSMPWLQLARCTPPHFDASPVQSLELHIGTGAAPRDFSFRLLRLAMFRPQTLVFLLLVALAALGNADPHGSSNKVCSNIRKCDRAVTPYCSSVLKIPIRTRTTTICKTSTVKQSPKPTTTVTVTITEVNESGKLLPTQH